VDFQSETVTDTVKESTPATFIYFCWVTLATKPVSEFILNFLPAGSCTGLGENPLLPLVDGSPKMAKGL
jgi:hypothetical protein